MVNWAVMIRLLVLVQRIPLLYFFSSPLLTQSHAHSSILTYSILFSITSICPLIPHMGGDRKTKKVHITRSCEPSSLAHSHSHPLIHSLTSHSRTHALTHHTSHITHHTSHITHHTHKSLPIPPHIHLFHSFIYSSIYSLINNPFNPHS